MKLHRNPAMEKGWRWSGQEWAWAAVLVIAVFVSYQPVWRAGYVWDDFVVLVQNTCIAGPLGLKEIWTTSAADICPLTLTTFYFEHALWGFGPRMYHLVNVAQHAASAVVLWRVLRGLEVPGAWLGAALWAVHPVEVESVAWVIEMKNTQSGLFFLLSIHFFLKWLKTGQPAWAGRDFALMLACAFLAMASKSSTVVLPVVLYLCAWWMQGRVDRRVVVGSIPVFFLSGVASVVSLWTQHEALSDGNNQWVRTWPERVAASGDAVWFYLAKLIWPHPLVTIYPRWQIDAGAVSSYLPMAAVIIVLVVLWANATRWARPWFMAFAFFLVALLPAVGLFDNIIFRYSLVFDHLQYLASMGPLALAGAGMFELGRRLSPVHPRMRVILAGGILALLGLLTWQRARTFHRDVTLWTATLAINPACWVAYNNLGCDAFNSDDFDQAMRYYRRALALNPSDATTHFNMGKALVSKGRTGDGIAELREACQLIPSFLQAHNDLGTVYLKNGSTDEAIEQYEKALVINPRLPVAYYNLGMAFSQKGRLDDAIAQYQKSIELYSTDGKVHNNLGTAWAQKGRLDDALAEFQKAVALDPKNFEAHRNLGSAYLQQRQLDSAIEQFNAAVALNPSDVTTLTFLGLAEGQKGDIPAAIAQFREVLRLKPDDVAVQGYLAKALAMSAGTR